MYELTLLLVVIIAVITAFILGFLVSPGEKSIREHNSFLKGKKLGYRKGYEQGYMEGCKNVEPGLLEERSNEEEISKLSDRE